MKTISNKMGGVSATPITDALPAPVDNRSAVTVLSGFSPGAVHATTQALLAGDRLLAIRHDLTGIRDGLLRRTVHSATELIEDATTELVHEAYLKLVDQSQAEWRDRAHFLALASVAMRHVLVDRAKGRAAVKRGGDRRRVSFDEGRIGADDQSEALLQLDEALERLAAAEPRLARVVEYRFFGGLTEDEIAEALAITVRTVQRDWAKARMLLRRALAS